MPSVITVTARPPFRDLAGRFVKATDELLAARRDEARTLGGNLAQYMRAEAPKGKTGRYIKSIGYQTFIKGKEIGFRVYAAQPLTMWIVQGTRPHIIAARRAKVLAFYWEGGPRGPRGIDFAAPTGTPIYAAGDGRIEFAGRKGGYGDAVIMNHGRGITTLYGHMSRFGKSARGGRQVRQGELIGYVGSTGASTSPHLHYEYRVRGVHKNPASIALPNTEIPARYAGEFRSQAEVTLAQLELAASGRTESFARR